MQPYQIIITSLADKSDYLVLPITPASISWSHDGKNETIDLASGETITYLKSTGLETISFDFTIPVTTGYTFSDDSELKSPEEIEKWLKDLKTSKTPVTLSILRTPGHTGEQFNLDNTTLNATLEDVSSKEEAEDNDDVTFSVSFQEYREAQLQKVEADLDWRNSSTENKSAWQIRYKVHEKNKGWSGWAYDGAAAGTTGQSRRIEAVIIEVNTALTGYKNEDISYQVHMRKYGNPKSKNYGWGPWVTGGKVAGTTGQSRQMEAIKIKTKGNLPSVSYKLHIQNRGWLAWSSDGATSGTTGKSIRAEALMATFTSQSKQVGRKSSGANVIIRYRAYVKGKGWLDWQREGNIAGTTGQKRQLEAIQIDVGQYNSAISYRVHQQKTGWTAWKHGGEGAGQAGKRVEAIQVRGKVDGKSLWYQVHTQNYGWTGWVHDGLIAGTTAQSLRIEAFQLTRTAVSTSGMTNPVGTAAGYLRTIGKAALDMAATLLLQHDGKVYIMPTEDDIQVECEQNAASKLTANIIKCGIEPENGDIVALIKRTAEGIKNIFHGYVISVGKAEGMTYPITAYDQLWYMKKNKDFAVFSNLTLTELIMRIIRDYGLDKLNQPNLAMIGYKIKSLVLENQTILDMVLSAIEKTYQGTGKAYWLYDNYGVITLSDDKAMTVTNLKFTDDAFEKIEVNTSIEEVYNVVKVYTDIEEKTTKTVIVKGKPKVYYVNTKKGRKKRVSKPKDRKKKVTTKRKITKEYKTAPEDSVKKYGQMMTAEKIDEKENLQIYANNLASKLSLPAETISISGAHGLENVRGGSLIYIDSEKTGIKGWRRVESATHHFKVSGHTMDLKVKSDDIQQGS